MPNEFQADILQSPVPVLGNNELGLAFGRSSLLIIPFVDLVVFGTIYKGYDIGILLDSSRFPKVAQQRAFASSPRFHGPGQLGKCDHGDVEFLGKSLEVSGDGRDLLFPVSAFLAASRR